MIKRVLLCATTTGYQIRAFGEAAERRGVRLLFASDCCDQLDDPWWDGAIPVRFHDERRSLDAVVDYFGLQPQDRVSGVIAVGDRPTILAAQVSAAVGLPGNPPEAARASRNKLQSRTAFRAAGLPTPAFRALSLDEDPHTVAAALAYPAVLKPLALSGSRGVMRVDDAPGFVSAFDRLRAILHSPDVLLERDAAHQQALVETFIGGAEYAVEGLLDRGAFRAFAIFDKPDPLDGPFFEETIYVTPPRAPAAVQERITQAVARAAAALELWHGPVHAECRVAGDVVYVLEVAPRPIGGLCARALRFTAPDGSMATLEDVLLRHALGDNVTGYSREAAASGVMMIPIPRRGVFRGVHGVEDAVRVPLVDDIRITAKPDVLLVPLPEGRSYLGFIFARGDTPLAVEHALRDAHGRLTFEVEKEIPLVGR